MMILYSFVNFLGVVIAYFMLPSELNEVVSEEEEIKNEI